MGQADHLQSKARIAARVLARGIRRQFRFRQLQKISDHEIQRQGEPILRSGERENRGLQ